MSASGQRHSAGNPFTGHTDWVNAVVIGQLDGRTVVASGSEDKTVQIWDAATGTPVGYLPWGYPDSRICHVEGFGRCGAGRDRR